MPRLGFEHKNPNFEREKTVYASDRAATVIDTLIGCKNVFISKDDMP
jgi:hypothetical protein